METTATFVIASAARLASPFFLEHRSQFSFSNLSTISRLSCSLTSPCLRLTVNWQPSPTAEPLDDDGQLHRTFLVDAFHQKRDFKYLFDELSRSGSCPLRILSRDGDWHFEKLRAVIAFLADAGRASEALQVFYAWKKIEKSRASVSNYSEVIQIFCERNLIDKAVLIFQDMEKLNLAPSLQTYNAMVHGYARIKEFQNSRALLTKMAEEGLFPTPETFNGLIRAYGNHCLYDDMSKCAKMMEAAGCYPSEVTYNILIQELARARLIERMEKFYRTVLSKRMSLETHTLITMLDAYADLGVLQKMERIYFKILNSKRYLNGSLIRKVAAVYIENCRFARLEEFGKEIEGRTGRTELVWCILLLSSAGLLSKKGMGSVAREMEMAKVRWSTTITNIFGLFYLKIKDWKTLNGILSNGMKHRAEPDLLTVGILFDACSLGFNGTHLLEKWDRRAYLESAVEKKTDPLVLTTFGKGHFMVKCEKLYNSYKLKGEKKKLWRYADLIRLVSRN